MRQKPNLIAPICVLTVLFSIYFGCAGSQRSMQPMVEKRLFQENDRIEPDKPPPPNHDGSLYKSRSIFNDLFIDTKARKVGDIVTVQIEESSEATNKADTKTGRASNLEAGIDTLFNLEDWYINKFLDNVPDDWPKPNPFGNPSVKGSMSSDFDGTGTTSRSGDLSAFITCQVREVLANGNLKIVGSREVLVNHETQLIILTGVIRPRDISDENVILSTFISDAKIAYSGTGVINDRQRPGWLANLLNNVWPF
jgi:flagellar L-ring protein precursor FlgH